MYDELTAKDIQKMEEEMHRPRFFFSLLEELTGLLNFLKEQEEKEDQDKDNGEG